MSPTLRAIQLQLQLLANVQENIWLWEYHINIRNQNLLNCEIFRCFLDCQSCVSHTKSSKELCSLDSTSSSLQPSKWSINHRYISSMKVTSKAPPADCASIPKGHLEALKTCPFRFLLTDIPIPKDSKVANTSPFPTRGTAATYCCTAEGWKSNGNNLKEPAVFNWFVILLHRYDWMSYWDAALDAF